jgi:hypothetical protein
MQPESMMRSQHLPPSRLVVSERYIGRDQPVVVATCDSAEATSPLSALKRRMSNDDVLALPPASAGGDFVFSIARNAARECGAAPSESHGKLHREVAG